MCQLMCESLLETNQPVRAEPYNRARTTYCTRSAAMTQFKKQFQSITGDK